MSEYQYYEFRAIDRPLDRTEQDAVRSISSRARITGTSFTNHYEWGDFKGGPRQLIERLFDLHLYLANWGERRLMMRLPARLLDREKLTAFLSAADWVAVWASGGSSGCDDERRSSARLEAVACDPTGTRRRGGSAGQHVAAARRRRVWESFTLVAASVA
jgi:hypothetical protein